MAQERARPASRAWWKCRAAGWLACLLYTFLTTVTIRLTTPRAFVELDLVDQSMLPQYSDVSPRTTPESSVEMQRESSTRHQNASTHHAPLINDTSISTSSASTMDNGQNQTINQNDLRQANTTSGEKPWKYFPWQLPSRKEDSVPVDQEGRWAIMIISMGQTAAKFRIVERIWLSIRRNGGFFGPILVLTDASPDRYLGILETDPQFFPIPPKQSHFNWDPEFVDEAMPYKRFKTYLTDYLPPSNFTKKNSETYASKGDLRMQRVLSDVQFILYLDADVVVGKPLNSWLDYCEEKLEFTSKNSTTHTDTEALSASNNTTSAGMKQFLSKSEMLFFEGNFEDMPIQSGQFVLNRQLAKPCLERWRHIIDANPKYNKDQYSLKVLVDEKNSFSKGRKTKQNEPAQAPLCSIQVIPQDPWLKFVKKSNLDGLVASKDYSTLLHIQNTGHARYMRDHSVKKLFRNLLHLTPSEETLNWKTPIRASPEWSQEQSKA